MVTIARPVRRLMIGVLALLLAGINAENPARLFSSAVAAPNPAATLQIGETMTRLSDGRSLISGAVDVAGNPTGELFVMEVDAGRRNLLPIRLSQSRTAHTATVLPDGRVLIVGGKTDAALAASTVEIIDLDRNYALSISNSSIRSRVSHTATLRTDGSVVVAGGIGPDGASAIEIDKLDGFSLELPARKAKVDVGRSLHFAQLMPNDDVLLMGGITDPEALKPTPAEVISELLPRSASTADAPNVGRMLAFLADNMPPRVAGSIPAQGVAGRAPIRVFSIRFSRPVAHGSMSEATMSLRTATGSIALRPVLAEGGMLLFLWPSESLVGDATYTLILEGLRDRAGRLMDRFVLSNNSGTAGELPPRVADAPAASPSRPSTRPVLDRPSAATPSAARSLSLVAHKVDVAGVAKSLQLPLLFEVNEGQMPADFGALARGASHGLHLKPGEMVLQLKRRTSSGQRAAAGDAAAARVSQSSAQAFEDPAERYVVEEPVATAGKSKRLRLRVDSSLTPTESAAVSARAAKRLAESKSILNTDVDTLRIVSVGASQSSTVVPEGRLPGVTHIISPNRGESKQNIKHFARMRLKGVYPGIDKVVFGVDGQVRFDWIVSPGADPSQIRQKFEGAVRIEAANDGHLRVHTPGSAATLRRPYAYQVINGERREIAADFRVVSDNEVAYSLGQYDTRRELVIDPVIEYATFISPASAYAVAQGTGWFSDAPGPHIAASTDGSLFILGMATWAQSAPSTGVINSGSTGADTAVLLKLNPAGDAVEYLTVFRETRVFGLALTSEGRPIILGPSLGQLNATGSAYEWQRTFAHASGGFVLKRGPDGDLFFVTHYVKGFPNDANYPSPPFLTYDDQPNLFYGDGGCLLHRTNADATQFRYITYLRACDVRTNAPAMFFCSFGQDCTKNKFNLAVAPDSSVYLTFSIPAASLQTTQAKVLPHSSRFGYWKKLDPFGLPPANPEGFVVGQFELPGNPPDIYSAEARDIAVDSSGRLLVASGAFISRIDDQLPAGPASFSYTSWFSPNAVNFGLGWALSNQLSVAADSAGGFTVGSGWDPLLTAGSGFFGNVDPAIYKWRDDGTSEDGVLIGWSSPNAFGHVSRLAFDGRGGTYALGLFWGAMSNPPSEFSGRMPGTTPTGLFVTKLAYDARLITSPNPSALGQGVQLKLETPNPGWIGTVTFRNGTTILGTADVSQGQATLTVSSLPQGALSLSADYSGDYARPPKTYATTHLVKQRNDSSTTALIVQPAAPTEADTLTLTAQVTAPNAVTGDVDFLQDFLAVGRVPVVANGTAVLNLARKCAGPQTFTAQYRGDTLNAASRSDPVSVTVALAPLRPTLSAPANNAVFAVPAVIPIVANLADVGCTPIRSTQLFVNGRMVRDYATGPPYTFDLIAPVEGRFDITFTVTLTNNREATSPVVRVFVTNGGLPVSDVEVTFLHHDAAGSAVAASSATGAVLWSRGYEPFGEFSSVAGATADANGTYTGTRQFYHGKPLDAESGLQYFGARYYDPQLGRFTGIDPAPWNEGNLHSFNRYAFANNNPMRFTDSDGRLPILLLPILYSVGKAALIGAGTGFVFSAGTDAAIQYAQAGKVDYQQTLEAGAVGAGIGAVTGGTVTSLQIAARIRTANKLAATASDMKAALLPDQIAFEMRNAALISTPSEMLAAGSGSSALTSAQAGIAQAAGARVLGAAGKQVHAERHLLNQVRDKPTALGASKEMCRGAGGCVQAVHERGGKVFGDAMDRAIWLP